MLTPEEIQSREFLVSLRGYDRDEVHAFLGRVAEQLAQTEAKASQLQQRLDRLKAQQPSAAALAEPPPAAQSSSPEPSAMFAEIGKETQRILEAAQEAGQQIQRKARQEADRDLQSARGQAAKLIAEGERRREHIERIVSELDQARAAMSVQLRGVGRTIDQTLRELAPSDQGGTGGGTSTVREAIGSQATAASSPTPAAASAPSASPAATSPSRAASAAAPAPAQDEAEPTETAEPDQTDSTEAAADEVEPPVAEEPAADEPAIEDTATEDTAAADAAQADAPEEPAAPAPPATDDNVAAAPEEPVIAPDEGADDAPAAPAPAATEDNEPSAASAADTESTAAAQSPAARPAAVAATAAAATEPAMPPSRDADAEDQPDAQALRAAALSPLHPKLVRKVKRELQEIQNIALDKVRRAKGQGSVDDFLPSEADTEGLGEGAGDLLRQAWDAGVASAAVLAGTDLDGGGETPDLAGTFLGDAAERVRSGLTSTLRMGLTADEGQQALSDRIGAVFAEFKGAQAEELAATHLIRAYEYGLLGAWAQGGISARRWVMGREPRCPEAKCRSNDQSGGVAVNDAFPSGHEVPPVHVGCTCTTVPELSA